MTRGIFFRKYCQLPCVGIDWEKKTNKKETYQEITRNIQERGDIFRKGLNQKREENKRADIKTLWRQNQQALNKDWTWEREGGNQIFTPSDYEDGDITNRNQEQKRKRS